MNQNAYKGLEEALNADEGLRRRFEAELEKLAREGVEDAAALVEKAAAALGFDESGTVALEDDALDNVAGGKALDRFDLTDFNFNTWLGTLLRNLLRDDSAQTTARGSVRSDAHAAPLPVTDKRDTAGENPQCL